MAYLLGIDLGTSSVKVVVTHSSGAAAAVASASYPIDTPQPGHAEQNPESWWLATVDAVRQALAQAGLSSVSAIGLAGQMHGTVLVSRQGEPLCPAIIWADQRSSAETAQMIHLAGSHRLQHVTGTLPAAGFMGPTLLWLRQHRPHLLEQAHQFLLPKDYLRWKLVGSFATEASDASATGLFDIRARKWAADIVEMLGLPLDRFPQALASMDVAGGLSPGAAQALGLPTGTPVVAGCADQVAQAVAGGLTQPHSASVTIGTGAQYFQPLLTPQVFQNLHTFCHALPDRWYVLGAMLSGGLSLRWLRDTLQVTDYAQLEARAATVPPGAEGLIFLPYLVGERAPIQDAQASGAFVGLTLRHHAGHLARAVMEGIAFSLRQIIEIVEAQVTPAAALSAVGNGLASDLWRQITADVLGRPLHFRPAYEQTAQGAALIAGLGVGLYNSPGEIPTAQDAQQRPTQQTTPQPAFIQHYQRQYDIYKDLYPAMRSAMHRLASHG